MRKTKVEKATRIFFQLAAGKMGYPGAEAAGFLGVTTSSVNRLAVPNTVFPMTDPNSSH